MLFIHLTPTGQDRCRGGGEGSWPLGVKCIKSYESYVIVTVHPPGTVKITDFARQATGAARALYTFDPDRPGSLSGWRGRILAGRGQMYTMLQRYITIIAHFLGRLNTTILAQKSPQRAVLCTQLASTGQYLCRGGGRKIFCRKTSKWYEIHKSLQSEN